MSKHDVRGTAIIDCLRRLAPETDAEAGDNVGLLIGTAQKDIKKILVSLDVSPEVVEEAILHHADMIISHHPVISDRLKHLKTDTPQGEMLAKLLKNDIAVYCLHSNLDIAVNGANDVLCQNLKLNEVEVLKVISEEKCCKLVTCIPALPQDYTSQIREKIGGLGLAAGKAGAGVIGNYSHVCDYVKGIQNFVPLESANPFIGESGVLESVDVDRLEMIVPESMIDEVVKQLIELHPYEEVEYDLYPLYETRNIKGLGRIGVLSEEKSLSELIGEVKKALNVSFLKVAGNKNKRIKKIAVCGGAKSALIKEAWEKGADLFITGEISYSEGILAKELDIAVIDAGCRATELPMVSLIKKYLESGFNNGEDPIQIIESVIKNEPFEYV